MPELAVIIVTYNSERFIERCLDNLQRLPLPRGTELIVIDNHSTDTTLTLLQRYRDTVTIIANPRNAGYGAACNKGLRQTTAPLVIFMNPDSFPEGDVIRRLASYLNAYPDTAAASCRILNPDRSIQASCRGALTIGTVAGRALEWTLRLSPGTITGPYLMTNYDHRTTRQVYWLTGAFLMVRRGPVTAVGGFDPRYFLYCEDADLSYRLMAHGYRVVYVPESGDVIHYHQRRSVTGPLCRETFTHLKSLCRFLLTHRCLRKRPPF